jgi:Ca2+-binding EF-hand superfamily protein
VVIEADPSDVTCLAIRSSAYQKKGDLEQALQDANQTIVLKPTYVRGYIRKACVLRAMKDYTVEVGTYLQGLEHCPGDESLTKGLSMARRLKTNSSKASQAAKTTQATRNAALSRQVKASQAADIASFVTQTKMNLELQMVALQAQLDLVSEITSMGVQSEKIDLLFSLITTSGQMKTLKDLVLAVNKATLLLKFGENIHQALAGVDAPDTEMTRASFDTFVQTVVFKLSTTIEDFAEFVVYQVLFTGVAAELKQSQAAVQDASSSTVAGGDTKKSVLNDGRMQALFVLFDKDADSTVDFKEVAIGLYPLTKCMGEAAKNAAGLLLMIDRDDQRILTYEQFAKLMLAASGAFGLTFDELADQLTLALANHHGEVDEEIMKEIMVAEEAYTNAAQKRKEEDQKKKTLDALSYSRTEKLFRLWDENGDGTIDFHELLHGLRRYQKSAMGSKTMADAERDALMIMGHDDDSNQALDPEEFAYAMANYAEKVGTSLHELIDFMCVVSSKSEGASEYEVRLEETIVQQRSAEKFKPSMGTILDTPEGDEDDEEEDDW